MSVITCTLPPQPERLVRIVASETEGAHPKLVITDNQELGVHISMVAEVGSCGFKATTEDLIDLADGIRVLAMTRKNAGR